MRTFLKLMVFSLAIFSFFTISGCNTVQGFGKDMQQGGEKIESAAKNSKNNHSED